jgi:prevent-host-death family protein
MRDTYTLREARARLSAIIRQVRAGHPVVVTVYGEPAVEIRAIAPAGEPLGTKLQCLAERGVLVRAKSSHRGLHGVARRRGALRRFLAERGI